ncbi:hypothetical protein WJX75_004580 [Coccomyxa subellipsoidea]|uniref:Muniscin C-terminal domain-containing protein n=1 Tax=Coccomyxa subellipsoidea TaxID=248742 RepID=A0ABR2YMI3_9CHLO
MVVGSSVAIVLRARGGSNFLIHSRGIDARDAGDCSREVAGVLTRFADAGGKGDTDRTGDNPPPFAFGEMTVASGGYRVVYRLVGGVYLMLVAAPHSNVLWLLELVSACVRILIAVSRGVEVTPDKLARRYPELYLALSGVLASGGSEVLSALAAAEAELAAIGPDAAKNKAGVMGRLGRSASASRVKGSGASASSGSATPKSEPIASSSGIGKRTLTDEVEDMSKVSFAFPPDALQTSPEKSRAAAASPAGRSPEQAAARSPVEAAADPFAASAAAAAAADRSILAGTGLEDLFDPSPTDVGPSGAKPSDPFGDRSSTGLSAFGEPDTDVAPDNPWASFDTPQAEAFQPETPLFGQPLSAAQQPFGAATPGHDPWASLGGVKSPVEAATSASAPAQPLPWKEFDGAAAAAMATDTPSAAPPAPAVEDPPREVSEEDVESINRGWAVELVERWRGSFVGDKLVRAGAVGEVWSYQQLAHSKAEVFFKCHLFRKSAMDQRLILSALTSAALQHASATGDPGTYTGSFDKIPANSQVAFLKYRLPALACAPPLLLRLNRQQGPRGTLLLVEIVASPNLPGQLSAVKLALNVPSAHVAPFKAKPRGAWVQEKRQFRWELSDMSPGASLVVRVAFPPAPKQADVAQGAKAVATFSGPEEESLSGIALESGSALEQLTDSFSILHGQATATLE